jgi:hypothetical protein
MTGQTPIPPSNTAGQFLVPETTVHTNGEGSAFALAALSDSPAGSVLITLGITKVVEQQALTISIHGSPDGAQWTAAPLAALPQKFYTGVSSLVLDLRKHPDVRYIRAQWKVARWGRGDKTPSFTFYVFAEPIQPGGVS